MISSSWGNRAECGALTCSFVGHGGRCLKGGWGLNDRNMEENNNKSEREKKQCRPNRNETKSGKIKVNHQWTFCYEIKFTDSLKDESNYV